MHHEVGVILIWAGAPDYVPKSTEATEAAETLGELMSSPTEERHLRPFSNGIETVDWMEGLSSQSMLAALSNPTVGWSASNGSGAGVLSTMTDGLHAPASPLGPETGLETFCSFQPLSDFLGYGPESHSLSSDAIADLGVLSPSRTSSALTSVSSGATYLSSAEYLNPAPTDRTLPTLFPLISSVGDEQERQQPPRHTQTDGQWLQKLVEINVQLFNHANKASNQAASSSGTPMNSDKSLTTDGVQSLHGNSFDETLVLSLHFVQVLRKLNGSKSSDIKVHPASTATPRLDPGSTLIIYSCYIRVLELLTTRLDAIREPLQAAAAVTSSPRGETANHSIQTTSSKVLSGSLPTLTACSCSLTEFPILHLRMTMELVEEILDVMSALLGPILRGPGDGEQRGEEISQQALSTREEAAYQIIRDIRRELKSSRRSMI